MIFLIGAGGHSKVIADILLENNEKDITFFDINKMINELSGFEVISELPDIKPTDSIIVCIGNNHIRKNNVAEFIGPFTKAIHPKAHIARHIEVGEGTVVMAGAVINPYVKIGNHCIINTNATIEHDCILEDFTHISPNATLSGGVKIGEGTHVGAGAVVTPGISIGKWVIIGAGSVIIEDIPDFSTVVGNPGRVIKN